MHMTTVESSNLRAVGYDQAQSLLRVEFLDGSVYEYFSVPSKIHSELMGADSHGQYFSKHVRKCFRYEKIK